MIVITIKKLRDVVLLEIQYWVSPESKRVILKNIISTDIIGTMGGRSSRKSYIRLEIDNEPRERVTVYQKPDLPVTPQVGLHRDPRYCRRRDDWNFRRSNYGLPRDPINGHLSDSTTRPPRDLIIGHFSDLMTGIPRNRMTGLPRDPMTGLSCPESQRPVCPKTQ